MEEAMNASWLAGLLALADGEAQAPPSFEARAAEIAGHVRDASFTEALAAADAALAAAEGFGEREVAELQFARGVILLSRELERDGSPAAGAPPEPGFAEARGAFSSARALAGPTSLRLAATYDMALVSFHEGERARAEIPEISGAPPGTPPPIPVPGATPAPSGPDPLQAARAAYSKAKEAFVERLRADWRDEDTRANLELLQRRLAELDALEKQREEEEQQQEEQKNEQEQQEQQDGEDQGPQKPEDAKPDPNAEPQEKPEDPADAQPEEQQEPPASPPQESQEPQTGGEQGEETPQEGEPPAAESEPEGPLEEVHLTREEVQQLLDRLAELEKEAGALEAALRSARRKPVPRDW
jgi:hypothetical protein